MADYSGVTRVCITWGDNWRCHPYFFLKKVTTFFAYHCITVIFLISLGCHPLEGVTPDLFLPVLPRLSTVLCKFSHNFFHSCVTPWRVSPGAVRPPSDATGWLSVHHQPICFCCIWFILFCVIFTCCAIVFDICTLNDYLLTYLLLVSVYFLIPGV